MLFEDKKINWKEPKIASYQQKLMLISESASINASPETVWDHLKTLQGAEQYIPVVTKSIVNGTGLGTTRICDIQLGEERFQIQETLVKLDESEQTSESSQMIQGILEMICNGLKKYHEQ